MKRTKEQQADVSNFEIGVVAGELEDLAYDVECIGHILTVLRKPLFYNNESEVNERTGYAIFDLIRKFADERADEIAALSAQVRDLRKVGEAEK